MPECWSAHVISTGIKTNHKYLATIWNFPEILSDKFFFPFLGQGSRSHWVTTFFGKV